MSEQLHNMKTTADGARDFRTLRQSLREHDADADDRDTRANNTPVIVEIVEDIATGDVEPHSATQVRLVNGAWDEIRPKSVRSVDGQSFGGGTPELPTRIPAVRMGRHGLCLIGSMPRRWAVLIDDLPSDPGIFPTGTISASSDQLTTSLDLTAYVDDYTILIPGAGTDGATLQTTISSATSTVATLSDSAVNAVTDADVTLLAVADAWIMEHNAANQLVRLTDADDDPVKKPVVNRFREVDLDANALIRIEYDNEWIPYAADCAASDWPWLEVSS